MDLTKFYCANIDLLSGCYKLWKLSGNCISELFVRKERVEGGKVYNMKVSMVHNCIQVAINGIIKIEVTDEEFSEGYIGLNICEGVGFFQNTLLEKLDRFSF